MCVLSIVKEHYSERAINMINKCKNITKFMKIQME